MDLFRFKTLLTSNISVDEEYTQLVLSKCKSKEVKKGEFLLRKGDTTAHSFFVENGLLRQYALDQNGKEHILQFAPENWIISNRESEYLKLPSSYFIEALEDSVVMLIDKKLIEKLSEGNPEFAQYNLRLLHRHISILQKRITMFQSASAEERYLDFTATYPDVLLRVPQTYVASYLGIAPESLSRIRKKMAIEHSNGS